MKIKHFMYEKSDGDESERQVMVLHENKAYLEGIDITKLTPQEVLQLFSIQREYEAKIGPFIKKAYRRFNQDNIKKILAETKE